jgi:hypothetical protein
LDVAQGIRKVAETLRAQRKQKWEEKQHALNQYKQKVEEILCLLPTSVLDFSPRLH